MPTKAAQKIHTATIMNKISLLRLICFLFIQINTAANTVKTMSKVFVGNSKDTTNKTAINIPEIK